MRHFMDTSNAIRTVVLIEKFTVTHLVKNFPSIYGK